MTTLSDLMSEAQLQERVINLAHARGWLVMHSRPAPDPRQDGKWRTVIDGDKGFPDLVLARGGRALFVELKSKSGRLSPDQRKWLDALNPHWDFPEPMSDETEVYLWKPADWPQIERVLA